MAKKSWTEAEKALQLKAEAFKAAHKIVDWGQKEHAIFITKVAVDCGLEAAKAPAFHAQVSLLGLGGNCSQFAQSVGFRVEKTETSLADLSAYLS